MKNIKWNTLVITCLVCLLSILPGMFLQNALPENMAVHFDLNGEPDNFAPKSFVVYGLPVFMMLLQFVCCIISDIKASKYGSTLKLEMVTKWILPVITIVLHIATLMFNLGREIDIRKVAVLIIGCVFFAMGICLPEVHCVKSFNVDAEKARKINRFIGIEMAVMGILALVTMFLPPITTIVWLFALIPCIILSIVYSFKVKCEKE